MIQAEIGGAARVDPGIGIQRPGFLIRDFTLKSSHGDDFRISTFRSRSNLVVVFAGYSDAMGALLEGAALHIDEFSAQDATIVVIVPYGPEKKVLSIPGDSPIILLHDKTHAAYRLSGATDENGDPVPLVYLTDRFGEIVSTHVASDRSMPPGIHEILNTLEFVNNQCPECEPPEWPR